MNKLKSGIKKLKWLSRDIGFATTLLKHKNDPSVRRILVYHGVVPNANKRINARFISNQEFETQLIYFKTHFHLVSIDDYFKGAFDNHKLTLSLTFDDGYLNNLTEVLPLLEKYQIPASFFITTIEEAGYSYLWADLLDLHWYTGPKTFNFNNTVYIKKRNGYWSKKTTLKSILKSSDWKLKKNLSDQILAENSFLQDEQYKPYFQLMNREQIKKLSSSPLATIGSHGLYHNCMDKIDPSEAKVAMKKSKSYLENICGEEVKCFAYPDGSYNYELISLAEEIGYKRQLVVTYNKPEDSNHSMLTDRFGINPYISHNNQIKSIVDGKY